jgi:hypothetical protein
LLVRLDFVIIVLLWKKDGYPAYGGEESPGNRKQETRGNPGRISKYQPLYSGTKMGDIYETLVRATVTILWQIRDYEFDSC